MSCCGQKRAAATRAMQSTSPRHPVAVHADAGGRTLTDPAVHHRQLRYIGMHPLSLTGPVSGRVYYFAAVNATAAVESADCEALLRTQLFVDSAG